MSKSTPATARCNWPAPFRDGCGQAASRVSLGAVSTGGPATPPLMLRHTSGSLAPVGRAASSKIVSDRHPVVGSSRGSLAVAGPGRTRARPARSRDQVVIPGHSDPLCALWAPGRAGSSVLGRAKWPSGSCCDPLGLRSAAAAGQPLRAERGLGSPVEGTAFLPSVCPSGASPERAPPPPRAPCRALCRMVLKAFCFACWAVLKFYRVCCSPVYRFLTALCWAPEAP